MDRLSIVRSGAVCPSTHMNTQAGARRRRHTNNGHQDQEKPTQQKTITLSTLLDQKQQQQQQQLLFLLIVSFERQQIYPFTKLRHRQVNDKKQCLLRTTLPRWRLPPRLKVRRRRRKCNVVILQNVSMVYILTLFSFKIHSRRKVVLSSALRHGS
jgi:hypothetical protein